ncbi:hypothetical protein ACFW2Y_28015 [Streptomyces sp. NPDC058877]|uniref:hypothetical protein n=1 Tax=unclassified Streptomyces TaxID=2593676 RepID=UPI0036C360BD
MLSAFASELGKKLAERWLTLLVLPGALYLAVAVAARVLGHAHALDPSRLLPWLDSVAESKAASGIGGVTVLSAGVLVAAAAAGIAAQALGTVLERVALAADWRQLPAWSRERVARRVAARRVAWEAAARDWHALRRAAATAAATRQPYDPAPRLEALRAMRKIAPESPDRPTWSGDRLNATAVRLERDLGVDIAVCWPHMWLLIPDAERTQLTSVRSDLARAAVLGGWALLYLPLVWWWWPALPIAVAMGVTAWRRTRAAADAWARALETSCRMHLRKAADQLGVDTTTVVTPYALGQEVTRLLEGSPPPPPPPSPSEPPVSGP